MQFLAEKSGQSVTSIDKEMRTTKRVKVREFNQILSCFLCSGYMINPVTVDNCLHSYCRSCIVKNLLSDPFCPQCKPIGGKPISLLNLKSDDILRMFIYKLVPGLYQQEREQYLRFTNGARSSHHRLEDPSDATRDLEYEENFFAPAEPISLSLEYHPVLLANCNAGRVPPIRYLQCPASVKIHHLKRFLCSKYDIDPDNKKIEVEVIYEEEILPNDFSLMDVGYCYNWKRHAPMKFRYRILLYGGTDKDAQHHHKADDANVNPEFKTNCAGNQKTLLPQSEKANCEAQNKSLSLSDDSGNFSLPSTNFAFKSKAEVSHLASAVNKHNNTTSSKAMAASKDVLNSTAVDEAPVKVIIARKSTDSKRPSPKRPNSEETTYAVTSDFKSLRSNDIRYSDYAVSSTTNNSTATKNVQKPHKRMDESATECFVSVSKCDIVVSIPSSQIPRSPYSSEERFENVSLAQLKTASKKSPTSTFSEPPSLKSKNVPKLKIELNSLKTKLTIPKPKSADARLESAKDSKRVKYRKNSLDETRPLADKVDLETYAKNIGLKPIEVLAPLETAEPYEKSKYSPNASPMSSSSSTTSSSNGGHFSLTSSSEISSSSHKKRKKKHSRESKDSNGKRRKLHAEISSQPAEESLKMKVKITASHNHKSQKSDYKRSASSEEKSRLAHAKQESTISETNRSIESRSNVLISDSIINNLNLTELNKTLCEESLSINKLMKSKSDIVSKGKIPETTNSADSSSVAATKHNLLPKPIINIKDLKIPSSPPLPPSLFKTTALAFTTLASAVSTSTLPKTTTAATTVQKIKESAVKPKPSALQSSLKSSYLSELPDKSTQKIQHFAVPNPPRSISNSHKNLNAPTSIASALNKHGNGGGGMQLKRSMSLDEAYTAASGTALTKQQKIEQDRIMRKTAYGAFLGNAQINVSSLSSSSSKNRNQLSHKEEIKLTTTIGNSFETPFYSPLSTAYATQDFGKRKTAATVTTPQPSSNISICKISDSSSFNAQTGSSMGASGTTSAAARQRLNVPQSQANLMRFNQQHLMSKPALEIVRITSNQIPADMLPLPPLSPPKNNRLMGPPVSIVKNSKKHTLPTMSPTFIKPLPSTTSSASASSSLKSSTPAQKPQNNAYRTSPPALINLRNTVPLVFPTKTSTTVSPNGNAKQNEVPTLQSGACFVEQPKSSLREFRPTSKEAGLSIVDVLDLSAGKVPMESAAPTPPITSSLEAALNKIKQNISACSAPGVTDNASGSNKPNSGGETSGDDLQNLHLLSESATTREKIAIKTQLFEKPKLQQPSLVVRQQNASVRNIPNPSALAFRNQLTTPTLLSIPTTTSTPKEIPAPAPIADEKLPSTSTTTASASQCLSTTTQAVGAARCTKKPTTIDQVAANLNIRAAAAEASAAKAATADEATTLDAATPAHVTDIRTEKLTTRLKDNGKSVQESANIKSILHATPQSSSGIDVVVGNGKKSHSTSSTSAPETKQQLHFPINAGSSLSTTVTQTTSSV